MAILTGANAVKLLRTIVQDYNFWGQSEGDSPLSIKRAKGAIDDKRILSLDASARRKADGAQGYKPPERTIRTESMENVFIPLVRNSLDELQQLGLAALNEKAGIETMQNSAEALEYYVQLYSAFQQLNNAKVCYVEDSSDPYTGLFIMGESADGETIYAQSLLIQT